MFYLESFALHKFHPEGLQCTPLLILVLLRFQDYFKKTFVYDEH